MDVLERPREQLDETGHARAALRRHIELQLRAPAGRARVARVVAEVACDAFGCRTVPVTGASRHGLGERLEAPVAEATTAAIERLVAELADVVEAMPAPAIDALAREQIRSMLGCE
jgi:hypothetical protein